MVVVVTTELELDGRPLSSGVVADDWGDFAPLKSAKFIPGPTGGKKNLGGNGSGSEVFFW